MTYLVRLAFVVVGSLAIVAILLPLGLDSASASTEVRDESSHDSLRVTTENRAEVRRGPVIRNIKDNEGTAPSASGGTNSGGGSNSNSSSGNSSSGSTGLVIGALPPGLSILERVTCMSGGMRLAYPGLCGPDTSATPAAPAAPAPAPGAPAPQVVSEPVTITITSSDLLELIPNSPEILMDRGPFGLKNAHTNFYASHHEEQTITQTMFDQEVTITATPVEYRWEYGDGNTFVTDLPGYPVDIFNTETDTSHQFDETGMHTVQLTTVFEGTFQVDGGEVQEVSSPVTQEADPIDIRIYRAVTRNVDQTCADNPDAWGCEL